MQRIRAMTTIVPTIKATFRVARDLLIRLKQDDADLFVLHCEHAHDPVPHHVEGDLRRLGHEVDAEGEVAVRPGVHSPVKISTTIVNPDSISSINASSSGDAALAFSSSIADWIACLS